MPKTIKQKQSIVITDKIEALWIYKQKIKEYESQFSDSTNTWIMCPQCWEYIDEVKIDSIP